MLQLGGGMDSYLIYKTLHLIGVIAFIGNIAVTGWWKTMADRTRDPKIIAFAQGEVTAADYVFTGGGIVLILIGGFGAAEAGNLSILGTPWIAWGLTLFILSGVVWVAALIPLQVMLGRMARDFAKGGEIPARFWELERRWYVFGAIATVLPLAALVIMTLKPA